jgi:hypothetical protein
MNRCNNFIAIMYGIMLPIQLYSLHGIYKNTIVHDRKQEELRKNFMNQWVKESGN